MSCESVGSVDDVSNHDGSVRKRVGKACDRCRLKKSKCDGSKPCGRCKADNQLCLFGERKKSHDKIYPKGYVELLEHQQSLLVNALQLVYRQYWTGPPLPEVDGSPLVHDLLESLGLLEEDGTSSPVSFDCFHFEEEPAKMQARLMDCETDGKHSPKSITSRPSLSPGSRHHSHFSDQFASIGPSTPLDPHKIPNLTTSPTSGFFAYPQPLNSVPTRTQLLQLYQGLEQMKQAGATFPSAFSHGNLSTDMGFDIFANNFPMAPTFDEMTDYTEEDSFGNFVDLGPS